MTSKDNCGTFPTPSSIFKSRWHALLFTSYPVYLIAFPKYSTQESNTPGTVSNYSLMSVPPNTYQKLGEGRQVWGIMTWWIWNSSFFPILHLEWAKNQQRSSFDLICSNHLWVLNLQLPVCYRFASTDQASMEFHQSISWNVVPNMLMKFIVVAIVSEGRICPH